MAHYDVKVFFNKRTEVLKLILLKGHFIIDGRFLDDPNGF
jgi:hypothetical protein